MLVHEGDQPGAPLAVHLERLGIDLPDDLAEFDAGLLGLFPVGGAVGVFAVGKFRQDHDGPESSCRS